MTHDDIWAAIENIAYAQHMSCSGLAKYSGLDATTFNKSKRWTRDGKPRWPSTHSLAKVLNTIHFDVSDLARFMPHESAD